MSKFEIPLWFHTAIINPEKTLLNCRRYMAQTVEHSIISSSNNEFLISPDQSSFQKRGDFLEYKIFEEGKYNIHVVGMDRSITFIIYISD